jgi:hypothetical protein
MEDDSLPELYDSAQYAEMYFSRLHIECDRISMTAYHFVMGNASIHKPTNVRN